ncbi:MAG: adenylate/guanylate cyclase domain-containing protein [Deltaproteobacteria bacterium]|nr:adenylate/guanylate cyclase domain-containing protein [Deltaproteobacteria bacterium]
MGIGLNDAEVIVGNIGSSKRSKYGLVGSGVNMASRIETYTVGGQILVSEAVRRKVGDLLRIDGKREVLPKGADAALTIYEVGGIGEPYNLALAEKDPALVTLARGIPLHYKVLGGKHVGEDRFSGDVVRLSGKSVEIELEAPLEALTNLEMNLVDVPEDLAGKDFYGKVIETAGGNDRRCVVRFTSAPPEVASYFLAHRQLARGD